MTSAFSKKNMKLAKGVSYTFSLLPNLVLLILCIIAFAKWLDLSTVEMEINDLELSSITVKTSDSKGQPVERVTIGIEPRFSTARIKPKHQVSVIGEGIVRITVAHSGSFLIQVAADGYKSESYEYRYDSPNDIKIELKLNQTVLTTPDAARPTS